jgi:phosphomevalonate kinase
MSSAPGKMFLFGEYAVLEGRSALIAAVDRQVTVSAERHDTWHLSGSTLQRVITSLAEGDAAGRIVAGILAAHDLGADPAPCRIFVDSSALFSGKRKLGFGSSAAVVVAVAEAVLGLSGKSLHDDVLRAFSVCRARHNEAQGGAGSGGDIAASLMGGVAHLTPSPLSLDRLSTALPIGVVTHPTSASTRMFVSRTKAFKAEAPERYAQHMQTLGDLCDRAYSALASSDSKQLVACVDAANLALSAFGKDAQTEIVTPAHERIVAVAKHSEGAAKPAGAGGGDLSLVIAKDEDRLNHILSELRHDGFGAERLRVARHGATGASNAENTSHDEIAPK